MYRNILQQSSCFFYIPAVGIRERYFMNSHISGLIFSPFRLVSSDRNKYDSSPCSSATRRDLRFSSGSPLFLVVFASSRICSAQPVMPSFQHLTASFSCQIVSIFTVPQFTGFSILKHCLRFNGTIISEHHETL